MDTSTIKQRGQSIRDFWSLFLKPLNRDVYFKNKTNEKLNSRNKEEPIASNVFIKSAYIDALDGITGSSSTMELW